MTKDNLAKFFGMDSESEKLTYMRVVNTLEKILTNNDERRFEHLKREVMPRLLTPYGPKKIWASAEQIYNAYTAGKVDDVVSRAVADVENHFNNKRKMPSFFNGGLTYDLLHDRRISRHDLFYVMLSAVEGLKCKEGMTLTPEQTEERVQGLLKFFRPMNDPDLMPDSISGWLVNATPWFADKMNKEGITRDYLQELIRDELTHYYKYSIYLNPGRLDKLKIRHFDYSMGTFSLGEQFSLGSVGLIYHLAGSDDSLVKLWNGDPLSANNWKMELEVADYMSDKKVNGIVPMSKVPVINLNKIVDGIHMPRIDGVNLNTFRRMRSDDPNIYLAKDMESAVADIVEGASSYGLHPVGLNANNVIVRKLCEGYNGQADVVIYGDPVVIDAGSWATEAMMREMLRDPTNRQMVQMQTKNLQEINNIVNPSLYYR